MPNQTPFCAKYPKLCTLPKQIPVPKRWPPPITPPELSVPLQDFLENLNEAEEQVTSSQWLTLASMFEQEEFYEVTLSASLFASELASGTDFATQIQSLQLQAKAFEKLQDFEANKLALDLSERLASAQAIHQQLNTRLLERE